MAKIGLFFLFQRQVCGSIRVPSGGSDYRFQFAGAPHAVPVKSKKKLVRKKMSFNILIDKETYLCIGLVFQKAGIRSQDGEK